MAADVFGVSLNEVDSDQRRVAKAVNFGVIYGQSPFGLAATLGIDKEVAATFIKDYFAKYSGVSRFIDDTLTECLQTKFAKTILGRRREIDGIRPKRGPNLNMPERTAVNTVIQGSAAELVFESPEIDVPTLIDIVRYEMEHAMSLSVPLVVDVAVGENWLDVETV